eukprot:CAMPEP_0182850482 /NCGR_PEP_ID=MMETSP0006_2-20121128/30120_1 /TAXON_ID=97485 /ORGANISM="Prymnesium parvum, Strain Texoma1" /LENGTH=63 /DNA_ID=CAMNT_0024981095 /DNA_START=341 /DNA_END=529 /DNA_ORIENTATION=-
MIWRSPHHPEMKSSAPATLGVNIKHRSWLRLAVFELYPAAGGVVLVDELRRASGAHFREAALA